MAARSRAKPDSADSKAIRKCMSDINKAAKQLSKSRNSLLRHREILKLVLQDASFVKDGGDGVHLYNLWHPYQSSIDNISTAMNATTTEIEEMDDHLAEQQEPESDTDSETDPEGGEEEEDPAKATVAVEDADKDENKD